MVQFQLCDLAPVQTARDFKLALETSRRDRNASQEQRAEDEGDDKERNPHKQGILQINFLLDHLLDHHIRNQACIVFLSSTFIPLVVSVSLITTSLITSPSLVITVAAAKVGPFGYHVRNYTAGVFCNRYILENINLGKGLRPAGYGSESRKTYDPRRHKLDNAHPEVAQAGLNAHCGSLKPFGEKDARGRHE